MEGSLFADDRPAKEQIREYITQAAAMQRADFNAIARATGTPKVEDYSDKSLTLVLLCNKGIREEGKFDQFQFQTDRTPRPNELVGEVNRGLGWLSTILPTAPVSMIHQDRITDITCEVKGNKATGVVSYQVPGMYFGKVKYIAEKNAHSLVHHRADRFRLRHPPDPRRAGIVEREGVSSLVHFHLMATRITKKSQREISLVLASGFVWREF